MIADFTPMAETDPEQHLPPHPDHEPIDQPSLGVAVVPRQYLIPFILLAACFATWGLANNLTDVLVSTFKRIMSMSDFQSSWIQVAFYGSYFCLAFPAALFIRRFTYKAGVLLGLGMFAGGALLFYPASLTMQYSHFLVALFILAGGLAILETSCNPYIIELGPVESATQRLNLAQSFNPLGSITGVLIGSIAILPYLQDLDETERATLQPAELQAIQAGELSAVMAPYVVIALLIVVLWIAIAVSPFPTASDKGPGLKLGAALGRILRQRHYVTGVIALFFYLGAQLGTWTFTIRYVQSELDVHEEVGGYFYLASIILFSVSRFVCTWLMRTIAPHTLLWCLGVGGVALSLVVILVGGWPGSIALVAISACLSLMFPTIYGLAIHGMGDDTKIAGSGLIMSIAGAAVFTATLGALSDYAGIRVAFVIVAVCFAVVTLYGLYFWKADEAEA